MENIETAGIVYIPKCASNAFVISVHENNVGTISLKKIKLISDNFVFKTCVIGQGKARTFEQIEVTCPERKYTIAAVLEWTQS